MKQRLCVLCRTLKRGQPLRLPLPLNPPTNSELFNTPQSQNPLLSVLIELLSATNEMPELRPLRDLPPKEVGGVCGGGISVCVQLRDTSAVMRGKPLSLPPHPIMCYVTASRPLFYSSSCSSSFHAENQRPIGRPGSSCCSSNGDEGTNVLTRTWKHVRLTRKAQFGAMKEECGSNSAAHTVNLHPLISVHPAAGEHSS